MVVMQNQLEWFAVYTAPRHEKSAARSLSLRQVDYYLPLYRSKRKWRNGILADLELPLFPGYLFVHIVDRQRRSVLGTPGVLTIVEGIAGKPARMRKDEIEALRVGLKLRGAQPHPFLRSGEKVRIRSGALAGFEGFVARKKTGFRVVLTLDLIMQSVAVEVDESELEPVS